MDAVPLLSQEEAERNVVSVHNIVLTKKITLTRHGKWQFACGLFGPYFSFGTSAARPKPFIFLAVSRHSQAFSSLPRTLSKPQIVCAIQEEGCTAKLRLTIDCILYMQY
jgi:hypothetical protein